MLDGAAACWEPRTEDEAGDAASRWLGSPRCFIGEIALKPPELWTAIAFGVIKLVYVELTSSLSAEALFLDKRKAPSTYAYVSGG